MVLFLKMGMTENGANFFLFSFSLHFLPIQTHFFPFPEKSSRPFLSPKDVIKPVLILGEPSLLHLSKKALGKWTLLCIFYSFQTKLGKDTPKRPLLLKLRKSQSFELSTRPSRPQKTKATQCLIRG